MEGKIQFQFSKLTQIWSAKLVREKKDEAHLFCMMDQTMDVIKEKVELKLTDLPNIAPITKTEREEITEKYFSKF